MNYDKDIEELKNAVNKYGADKKKHEQQWEKAAEEMELNSVWKEFFTRMEFAAEDALGELRKVKRKYDKDRTGKADAA